MTQDPNLYVSSIKKVELTKEGFERLAYEAIMEGFRAAIQVIQGIDVQGDVELESFKEHIVERLRTAEVTSVAFPHIPEEGDEDVQRG